MASLALCWIGVLLFATLFTNAFGLDSSQPLSSFSEETRLIATLVASRDYVAGALVLSRSLTATGSTAPRVALIPPTASLTPADISALESEGWKLNHLDESIPCPESRPGNVAVPRFVRTCDKLHAWTFGASQVLMIDADSIALKNVDWLFSWVGHCRFAATVAPDETAREFQSALLLLQPDEAMFRMLKTKLAEEGHDYGEIMLLNSVFSEELFQSHELEQRVRAQNQKEARLSCLLPLAVLIAQTSNKLPMDPKTNKPAWDSIIVYDFAGPPPYKPWRHWSALRGNETAAREGSGSGPARKSPALRKWMEFYDEVLEDLKVKGIEYGVEERRLLKKFRSEQKSGENEL